jgi:hypothetical protein
VNDSIHVFILLFEQFLQMQAQAQRNSQANSSQQSLFSQLSAQQMFSTVT